MNTIYHKSVTVESTWLCPATCYYDIQDLNDVVIDYTYTSNALLHQVSIYRHLLLFMVVYINIIIFF